MSAVLFIGNRNYSSWSLRAWLALRWAGLEFEEIELPLDRPGYGEQSIEGVLAVSPNGRVPCLHADGFPIWDTLAIAEWAAEAAPRAALWPADRWLRARARSLAAEMHAGFSAVREHLPMNILRRCPVQGWPAAVRAEIDRLDAIWSEEREAFAEEGPWLMGRRTIADAFYAPVATRMRTYGVALSSAAQEWCATILADPDFLDWEGRCVPDSWDASGFSIIDGLYA